MRFAFPACAYVLLLVGVFFGVSSRNIEFTDDIALTFAVARSILSGEVVLLGPPSHMGGRHFSGIYYWFTALGMHLAGGDDVRAIAFFSGVNAAAALLMVGLAAWLSPPRVRHWGAFGAATALLSWSYIRIFRIPWHAHFLVVPSSLFVGALLYALRRPTLGPGAILVLASTILIQAHYSAAPLIAAGWIVYLWLLWTEYRRGRPEKLGRVGWLALSMALLLWIPPVVYELRYPSNLALLATSKPSATGAGIYAALRAVVDFLTMSAVGFHGAPHTHSLVRSIAEVGSIGALVGLAVITWTRAQRWVRGFALFSLLAFSLYGVALVRLPPPPHEYYLYALIPVVPILSGILWAHGGEAFVGSGGSTRRLRSLLLAAFVVLTLQAGLRARSIVKKFDEPLVQDYFSLQFASDAAQLILADLPPGAKMQLLPKAWLKLNKNAIYYFLGPAYWPRMEWSEKIRELPFGRNEPEAEYLYLVGCPRPQGEYRRDLLRRIRWEWDGEKTLTDRTCSACDQCLMKRWQRRPSG